jgi:hypothetical protein
VIWWFYGIYYGEEYLNMGTGDLIERCQPPPEVDPEGWAYGRLVRTGKLGWYPGHFAPM